MTSQAMTLTCYYGFTWTCIPEQYRIYRRECENDTIQKDNLVANGQMHSASHYQFCQLHPPELGLAMPTVIDQKSSH